VVKIDLNITHNEFIKIENKPTIIDKFNEQDKLIVQKTKPENKNKVKDLIVKYSLTHPLKPIFDLYENDYEKLKMALENFSKKREEELLELTKNL
jgi:hypothetical protein